MLLISKAVLVLIAVACHYISLTPPLPAPSSDELMKNVTSFERLFRHVVRSFSTTVKIVGCAGGLCEAAVILAHECLPPSFGAPILKTLVFNHARAPDRIGITPLFLIGWSLVVFGAAVRLLCYRALGRFFTFELALRHNHQLVTRGPYTVVRHPSYTALMAGCGGLTLCHAGPHAWLRECGALETPGGRAVACGWLACFVYSVVTLCARTIQEDRLLQREFGAQWTQWAKDVRYRLLPGVY